MTTPQPQPFPQNPPQRPQGQAQPAWTNPVDSPPPFPNTSSNPYTSYGAYENQGYAPVSSTRGPAPRPQSSDDRLWAIGAHLSAALAVAVSVGWLPFLGPLIVYLLQKDKSLFVRRASAGAFNFALSMALISVLGWILTFTVIGAVIGIPMIIAGGLGPIVLGIVGAIKASNNESYEYPLQLKVLS